MRISVVISAFTSLRANDVLKCINSLKNQTVPPFEILLILDPDPELLNFYSNLVPHEVKIFTSTQKGLSGARNTGIKNSNGDIVAFIDDDATANHDWIERVIESYSNPTVVSVGGFIKPLWNQNGFRPKWFPEELDWIIGCTYRGLPETKSPVRNVIGCNMSFRRSIFSKVGGFNTNLGRLGNVLISGEEAEVSLKIRDKIPDSQIIYDPELVVYHNVNPNRLTIRYIISRSFREGSSKAILSSINGKDQKSLTTENNYLLYILTRSIPSKFAKGYSKSGFSQLSTIILSTFFVAAGYLDAKVRYNWKNTEQNRS